MLPPWPDDPASPIAGARVEVVRRDFAGGCRACAQPHCAQTPSPGASTVTLELVGCVAAPNPDPDPSTPADHLGSRSGCSAAPIARRPLQPHRCENASTGVAFMWRPAFAPR